MIKFRRTENKVIVDIEHGIFHNDGYFSLDVNQNHDYQAELLRKAFQDNLNRHLQDIKEKYYNEGWKDAKAKVGRRSSFWGGWEKK